MSDHAELIAQGRHEAEEDRRIAGIMRQDRNRRVMEHRAAVTDRLCDALDQYTSEIRASKSDAVRAALNEIEAEADADYDDISDAVSTTSREAMSRAHGIVLGRRMAVSTIRQALEATP